MQVEHSSYHRCNKQKEMDPDLRKLDKNKERYQPSFDLLINSLSPSHLSCNGHERTPFPPAYCLNHKYQYVSQFHKKAHGRPHVLNIPTTLRMCSFCSDSSCTAVCSCRFSSSSCKLFPSSRFAPASIPTDVFSNLLQFYDSSSTCMVNCSR